ncbi:hypothetical protein K6119_08180 [Paracrocinitomix mangrovi]|uniref:hypothetical protein n=1 Tax=Paracrocinitomix mangrovi TaxID=2862509 RepID=UPI001C8D6A29|nr:hypothetical protein [Paracrocinitomix mangrovi]UKN03490.1 hypothetical protein K6119_08180 [Paracrocinitomix mangrovi]
MSKRVIVFLVLNLISFYSLCESNNPYNSFSQTDSLVFVNTLKNRSFVLFKGDKVKVKGPENSIKGSYESSTDSSFYIKDKASELHEFMSNDISSITLFNMKKKGRKIYTFLAVFGLTGAIVCTGTLTEYSNSRAWSIAGIIFFTGMNQTGFWLKRRTIIHQNKGWNLNGKKF